MIVPAQSVPDYRIETSLYTALPALEAFFGRAAIGNLHDRVGEEEQLRGSPHSADSETLNGAWARVFGWKGHHDGGALGIYSEEGPTFDYDLEAIQAGTDIYRREKDDGQRDHAGVYATYGQARGKIYHINGVSAGEATVDAASLGGYWTHFWASGTYLDAVGQFSWYDDTAQSTKIAPLKDKSTGWALSLEGARPFHLKANFVLEPQAQLTYQEFNRSTSSDIAALVTFQDTRSLVGRLGLRAARTWTGDKPDHLETTGWLRLNLTHEFLSNPETTFSSEDGPVNFRADLGKYQVELNAGLTKQMSQLTTFYGGLGYQRSLEKDTYAWTGKLGVRFNW